MFTLHYFIIIQDARNVDLRICASLLNWWKYPCAKSEEKNASHAVSQKNRLTYTCSERTVRPNFGMPWSDTAPPKDKRRHTSVEKNIKKIYWICLKIIKNIIIYIYLVIFFLKYISLIYTYITPHKYIYKKNMLKIYI